MARIEQTLQDLLVAIAARDLADRPLVVVDLQPLERFEDLIDVLGVERSRSVSSIRSTRVPPAPRASSQL